MLRNQWTLRELGWVGDGDLKAKTWKPTECLGLQLACRYYQILFCLALHITITNTFSFHYY
jgi:hypothetical protein